MYFSFFVTFQKGRVIRSRSWGGTIGVNETHRKVIQEDLERYNYVFFGISIKNISVLESNTFIWYKINQSGDNNL